MELLNNNNINIVHIFQGGIEYIISFYNLLG